jgi:hypothetical protein
MAAEALDIKAVIEKLEKDYKSEDFHLEERPYGIGFSFKGEWYNLSGYNFLAQLEILTTALKPLMA